MGRKIPGKKHRTIKDPIKQKQKRLDSLRLKINNPPANSHEQEVPKSLLRIMELKSMAKQNIFKKPKRKRKNDMLLSLEKFLGNVPAQKGMTKPDRHIPNLVQRPDESDKSFLRRVNFMTQGLINEVEFEKKFGVEIKKNPETGEVVEVKNMKRKKSKSKKKKLSEKRNEKLTLKRENANNFKDFNQLKDKVEFGEVVHRPPQLQHLKAFNRNQSKSENYKNLLLNDSITKNEVKCKSKISELEKEKANNEREFIVEAYRKAKKKVRNKIDIRQ